MFNFFGFFSFLSICGSKSGRDVDKFKETKLTRGKANELQYAPVIEESPVNIECKLERIEELGSHHMFIARVVSVQVDEAYLNETGKFCLNDTGLIAYSHGEYRTLGESLGTFGYSIKKKAKKKMFLLCLPKRKTVITQYLSHIPMLNSPIIFLKLKKN